jgi:hypothetical protein
MREEIRWAGFRICYDRDSLCWGALKKGIISETGRAFTGAAWRTGLFLHVYKEQRAGVWCSLLTQEGRGEDKMRCTYTHIPCGCEVAIVAFGRSKM